VVGVPASPMTALFQSERESKVAVNHKNNSGNMPLYSATWNRFFAVCKHWSQSALMLQSRTLLAMTRSMKLKIVGEIERKIVAQ
jgi:hypothetical protein